MSAVIGAAYEAPLRITKKESTVLYARVFLDNTGAITTATTFTSDPGVSPTKTGTGAYTVAFPKCPSDAYFELSVNFSGTFPTAGQFVRVTSFDAAGGSMTLVTSTTYGGAAADLNQPAELHLQIVGNKRSGN